jgi:hypothetical protein
MPVADCLGGYGRATQSLVGQKVAQSLKLALRP